MMVPPEGMGVVGVKPRVTGTEDLPATRSDEAMANDNMETCDKDDTLERQTVSPSVESETASLGRAAGAHEQSNNLESTMFDM